MQRRSTWLGAKPYGNCRRHENVENPKAGFPHFHSALENSPPKKRGCEFPTVPTGPTTRVVSPRQSATSAVSIQ